GERSRPVPSGPPSRPSGIALPGTWAGRRRGEGWWQVQQAGAARRPDSWTLDRQEIERRLLDTLTPSSFEHLVVSLLQLEHRHETWSQVGGPGDGGIDDVGAAEDGAVAALLQCKWQYDGQDAFPTD